MYIFKNIKTSIKILVLLILTIFSYSAYSQGCSDAGFCTMGAMRPSQVYTRKINFKLKAIEFNQYRGKTTLSPVVNVSTLDFTFGINEKTSFQLKLPYQWINGNLGSTSGLGDIAYSFTHNVYSSDQFNINATLGGKIPSNQADVKKGADTEFTTDGEEHTLPMYYQTSLGTYDIVAGASLLSKKWMFAFGIQVPFAHNNQNDFRYEEWEEYPSADYLMNNFLAYDLKRGSDIMIRAERAVHFSNLDIRVGILPIYRFTKDQIRDPDSGEYVKLDKTTGLALSGILGIAYHLNTFNTVKFLGGHKFIDREVNPDGLTRHSVASLAYVWRF